MARRQPGQPEPTGALPSSQPDRRVPSHHLASVVHHFLTDDETEPPSLADLPALGAVAGYGSGAGVPRVAWLLGEAGDLFTWHDLGQPGPQELNRLEAGADVVRGLSDCRGAWAATGPVRPPKGEDSLPEDRLERCRLLASRVAPGIPVRATATSSIRLKQVLADLPGRLEPQREVR